MDYQQAAEMADSLAARILESGFRPNYIIAVARGGFVPAYLLSTRLCVERLGSIGVRYTGPERGSREIYGCPWLTTTDRALIVEDAVESGRSLDDARQVLIGMAGEVRTAALVVSSYAAYTPDISVETADSIPRFPWERDH